MLGGNTGSAANSSIVRARKSLRRAAAIQAGAFASEIVPRVRVATASRACTRRTKASASTPPSKGIAALKPAPRERLITAATRARSATAPAQCSSSTGWPQAHNLTPLARIVTDGHGRRTGDHAGRADPRHAARVGASRAPIDDIDLFEVNEAFASVPLAWIKEPAPIRAGQRQWRRDRARPSARRDRRQADGDARTRAARAAALRPADDVRGGWHRERHDYRGAMTPGRWSASTERLGSAPDAVAPDGSEVRVLCQSGRGGMAHFELAAARGVPGRGRIARSRKSGSSSRAAGACGGGSASGDEIVEVEPGLLHHHPAVGTRFQFRSDSDETLSAIGVTMPPWPGEDGGTTTSTDLGRRRSERSNGAPARAKPPACSRRYRAVASASDGQKYDHWTSPLSWAIKRQVSTSPLAQSLLFPRGWRTAHGMGTGRLGGAGPDRLYGDGEPYHTGQFRPRRPDLRRGRRRHADRRQLLAGRPERAWRRGHPARRCRG